MDFGSNTDSIEATSLGYKKNYIQVYSNSWGPNDNGFIVDKPGILLERTFENAVTNVMFTFHIYYFTRVVLRLIAAFKM